MAVTALGTDEIEPPAPTNCWCCGRRDGPGFVRLSTHAEVAICFRCLDWLNNAREHQIRTLKQFDRRSRWGRIRGLVRRRIARNGCR